MTRRYYSFVIPKSRVDGMSLQIYLGAPLHENERLSVTSFRIQGRTKREEARRKEVSGRKI